MVSSATLIQLLTRFFLVLALIAVASSSARPHFGDTNQSGADQDTSNLVDTSSGLTNEQMEQLLQRLVEYNRASQYPYGWERLIRGPEMKRQSRFRQCYFNPLSDNNLFKSAGTQPTKLILNMY
ncbi:hypothetical protein QE152_g23704 [Popillia japonica]|uniref:Uncharacterized protein n=1 Tax=Popillia japonica TaxID=7064 RepID=A0AAW1KG07_POPJA